MGAALVTRVAGQATQPAPSRWAEVVTQVAAALSDESGAAGLGSLVTDDVSIQSFGNSTSESRYRVQQQTGGLNLVAARAYSWPAETIASDLAADVRESASMPETVRQQFTPRDDAEAKRANATAQQWVFNVLQPAPGQVVALIVFWEPQPMTTSFLLGMAPPEPKPPLFILLKGQKGGNDEFHITHIVYGDARQALN